MKLHLSCTVLYCTTLYCVCVCMHVLVVCRYKYLYLNMCICLCVCVCVYACMYLHAIMRYSLLYHQAIHGVMKSSHPLHWAGFAVIGKDIVLKDNSVELSLAIRSMLQGSLDYTIAALKTMHTMVSEPCNLLYMIIISHELINNHGIRCQL